MAMFFFTSTNAKKRDENKIVGELFFVMGSEFETVKVGKRYRTPNYSKLWKTELRNCLGIY